MDSKHVDSELSLAVAALTAIAIALGTDGLIATLSKVVAFLLLALAGRTRIARGLGWFRQRLARMLARAPRVRVIVERRRAQLADSAEEEGTQAVQMVHEPVIREYGAPQPVSSIDVRSWCRHALQKKVAPARERLSQVLAEMPTPTSSSVYTAAKERQREMEDSFGRLQRAVDAPYPETAVDELIAFYKRYFEFAVEVHHFARDIGAVDDIKLAPRYHSWVNHDDQLIRLLFDDAKGVSQLSKLTTALQGLGRTTELHLK